MKKCRILLFLLVGLSLILSGCSGNADKNMADGTFTGEAQGKKGTIAVEVTTGGGKIKAIEITETHETEGLSEAPMQSVIDRVLKANTADVDCVSGATISTQGVIDAIKAALVKAGATKAISAEAVKENTAAKPVKTEETYDVVVIGGGGAGLTAAIEANNNGASVVILEKMSFVGGNTLISGGEFAASNNWLQKEEGIEDSIQQHFEDTMKGGDFKNDEKLVMTLAENALSTAEWMKDYIKVEFEDHLFHFGGHSVKRSLVPKGATASEIIKKLKIKIEELKIPVKLDTKAVELVVEGGRVTGVKATGANGTEIIFHATNGVVIASGGFGANVDLRMEFNPKYDEKYLTTNAVSATGDGLVMAREIGADNVGVEYIQTYPICDPLSGMLLYTDDARFYSTILVNKEGNRFVEELGRRDEISEGIIAQTGNCAYEIWDEPITVTSKIVENHKAEMDYLYENKLLGKFDTIKEAAAFFDIDYDQLTKSIERFNTFALNGKDEDFNKRGHMTPIVEAPFYIMKCVPSVHHTMGGIKIDNESRVISKDGNIINGLYAAGEVTGGIHGTNRLGSNAIADISVFGRIAGRNAAEKR